MNNATPKNILLKSFFVKIFLIPISFFFYIATLQAQDTTLYYKYFRDTLMKSDTNQIYREYNAMYLRSIKGRDTITYQDETKKQITKTDSSLRIEEHFTIKIKGNIYIPPKKKMTYK